MVDGKTTGSIKKQEERMIGRRSFVAWLLVWVGAGMILGPEEAAARGHRRRRRRRRRIRRRIRRRAAWRIVAGRRLLVVPLAIAVGSELLVDDKVVIVKEVHRHRVVVEHSDGKTETIEVVKKDTPENTKELEGSEIEEK